MWIYNNEPFTEIPNEFVSFVYIIERLNYDEHEDSPIYYIGKKTFFNKKKINNKKILVESDWYNYYGSSEWLSNDILRYGKSNFKRTILYLCRTQGDSGYLESKEQIERNVLHIDENNYKLYYNKNILGRYRNEPELYETNCDIRSYYNLDNINDDTNKVWINNGTQNRIVSKKMSEDMICSNGWLYGRCEKHIAVNDGVSNFMITHSKYDASIHNIGYLKKYVTNGTSNKKILVEDIDDFLSNNKTWKLGFTTKNKYVWITNGTKDLRVKDSDVAKYTQYKRGRTNNGIKNKKSVFKNNEYKWIYDYEIDTYLNNGWTQKGRKDLYKLYICTNEINQKHFLTIEEMDDFLSKNSSWRKGQINRENFNTNNMVFAIDMTTNERVTVTKEEYDVNDNLTTIKSKKIKVKSKNKKIFEGYVDKFSLEYNIPKNIITKSARSKNILYVSKGKYTYLNEHKYHISYI